MSDLVSIIITSYNAGRYLEQCIRSVLGQTYPNLEIIIVNDGSTDNTEAIAKAWDDKYGSIKYIYQSNSGVSVARNRGIAEASGNYVMFVDGDDYLDNNIVERLIDEAGGADIICCCCKAFKKQYVYEDFFFETSFKAQTKEEREKLFLQLLNGNLGKPDGKGYTAIGVPWGKLYRLDFLKNHNILFDPRLRRMQDNIFNMYAFCDSKSIIYINEPLYNYRLNHIQSKSVSYGLEIWKPFLEARKQFWFAHKEVLTLEMKREIQYELNIAFISTVLSETKNMQILESANRIAEIRRHEIFEVLFSEKGEKSFPFRIRIFYFLAKYHLNLILAICIRMYNQL